MKVSPEIRWTVLALLVFVTVAQLMIVPWEAQGSPSGDLGLFPTRLRGYAPLWEPIAEGPRSG